MNTNTLDRQKTLNKLIKQIETSNSQEEVVLASIEASKILSEDYQYDESILILDQLLPLFQNQKEHPSYDVILILLIENAIKANLKTDALNYINLRKESLKILDEYKYTLDLIEYKKAFDEPYFHLIDDLIRVNVSKDIVAPLIFERLVSNKDNYKEALKDIELLKMYEIEDYETSIKVIYYYLLYNNDLEALEFEIEEDDSVIAKYYHLLLLIDTNAYKQAQILEVEYEHYFDELPLNLQEHLYKKLTTFYKDDLRSLEHYNLKLENVTKELTKKEVKEESVLKVPKKKKAPLKQEEVPLEFKDAKLKQVSISHDEVLFKIDKYMLSVIGLKRNVDFHEYLRQMSIQMEKFFDFSDIIFNFNYEVYHYKKERLYEKNIDRQVLDTTILGISASKYEDIIEYTKNLKYDFDVLTNKRLSETDVKSVYVYALENRSSICFYKKTDKDLIHDDLTFKLLSNFISYEIKTYKQLNKLKDNHEKNLNLFNSNLLALSHGLDPIKGNNAFKELFNTNKLTFAELLLKIDPKERIRYNELMDSLLRKEINDFNIKVTLNDKTVYINHVLNDTVYGFYIDITSLQEKQDELMEKALKTPINTYTLFAFEEKFDTYIKNKTTFLLIELDNIDNIITLYGKDEGKIYFESFVSYLTNYGNVYLFDGNSVILTLDFNDVRSVIKRVNSIFEDRNKLSEIKQFSFKIGIIRYPVNTKEKNINKIYEYLNVALEKAKLSHNHYAFFNYEDYEQTVFEVEIIRQIDRLISLNQLEVTFTQIVNQKTNTVYAYDIGLHSDSLKINPNYYYLVAKKKNNLKVLERYMLKEAFKALERIYKETNRYIKLSINVSAETIRDADFNPYLIGLYKTYNIPYNAVDIVILMKHGFISDYETTKELKDLGILIGTDNLSFIKEPQTKIFHYKELPDHLDEKALSFIDYLNKFTELEGMDLIIYNVDNAKDKLLLKTKGCAFIRGDSVDKKFTLSEIINLIKGVI